MKNLSRQLGILVINHRDAEIYYRKCAGITTETDWKKMFEVLSSYRKSMLSDLLSTHLANPQTLFFTFHSTVSFLRKVWRNVKIALIINDRTKISRYCQLIEYKMLREYQQLEKNNEMPEELDNFFFTHQEKIKAMVEKLKNMPELPYSMQKRMVA
jgi:hypothetical protein